MATEMTRPQGKTRAEYFRECEIKLSCVKMFLYFRLFRNFPSNQGELMRFIALCVDVQSPADSQGFVPPKLAFESRELFSKLSQRLRKHYSRKIASYQSKHPPPSNFNLLFSYFLDGFQVFHSITYSLPAQLNFPPYPWIPHPWIYQPQIKNITKKLQEIPKSKI